MLYISNISMLYISMLYISFVIRNYGFILILLWKLLELTKGKNT